MDSNNELTVFFIIPIILKAVVKIPMSITFIIEAFVVAFYIPTNVHVEGVVGIDRAIQFVILLLVGGIVGIIELIIYFKRRD